MASGTIDIMPTILHLLGYEIPARVDGRVLREALVSPAPLTELPMQTSTFHARAGSYSQHLTATTVGATTYLDRGWVE